MKDYAYIIESISTRDQSRELLEELDTLLGTLFSAKEASEERFGYLASEIKARLLEGMRKEGVDMKAPKQIQDYLQSFIAYIKGVPILKLTVVFFPSEKKLKELQGWMQEATKKKILVDITVDPSIIAGAKLEYNGIYKNYSLS